MAMNISGPNAPSSAPNAKRTIKMPEAADSLLASELNSMTVADRTHVFEVGFLEADIFVTFFLLFIHTAALSNLGQEIHGVAPFPKEENSSEALQKSLHLLSEALDRIEEKPAFDEAQRMVREEGATTFVNDDYFRLRFLRAEEFRPQQAAERMVLNLELLHRYVGQEGLRRPIRMSDLDETSIAVMKTGSFQSLPSRDRSGRRIAVRIGPLGLDFIKNENSVSTMELDQGQLCQQFTT